MGKNRCPGSVQDIESERYMDATPDNAHTVVDALLHSRNPIFSNIDTVSEVCGSLVAGGLLAA